MAAMEKEIFTEEKRSEIMAEVRGKLAKFVPKLNEWGLESDDIRISGEVGINLAGLPLKGRHLGQVLRGSLPHVDIYINEEKYTGPRGERVAHQLHLPIQTQGEIAQNYGLDIRDFFIGDKETLSAPTVTVELEEGIKVKVHDPLAAVGFFAKETLLRPGLKVEHVGPHKIIEWYGRLELIKEAAEKVGRRDVVEKCTQLSAKSEKRWGEVLEA